MPISMCCPTSSVSASAGGMSDEALVEKKLALIESCVREVRELARPEAIASDLQ